MAEASGDTTRPERHRGSATLFVPLLLIAVAITLAGIGGLWVGKGLVRESVASAISASQKSPVSDAADNVNRIERICSKYEAQSGFTLIELSIVLVIIGLIVGGVLVGQDLIRSAEVRAQLSQIEKYQTAVNTFRGKYGYIPGDINNSAAVQFGFAARGQFAGEGDGNGILEGINSNGPSQNYGDFISAGETAMFWRDLSQANLIDGSFTAAKPDALPSTIPVTGTTLASFFPAAKLGRGNYVYVWSGGIGISNGNNPLTPNGSDGQNYFSISAVDTITSAMTSHVSMTVQQAYNIDRKLDDGLALSGTVKAWYLNQGPAGAGNGFSSDDGAGRALSQSAITCYDNGGIATAPMKYSLSWNNGFGTNCALSFRFQ